MKLQKQMYYESFHKAAERDMVFLELVKDGMTRSELQRNIDRRPHVWSRYNNWLAKLPD